MDLLSVIDIQQDVQQMEPMEFELKQSSAARRPGKVRTVVGQAVYLGVRWTSLGQLCIMAADETTRPSAQLW